LNPVPTIEGTDYCNRYLQVDPNIKLTIFDSERTLGGVWSKDRLFPGFMADGPTSLFDYSDLPMRDAINLKDWSDLPGEKVYDYLHAYAEKFNLIERLRSSTTISHISRNLDRKACDVMVPNSEEIVTCDKLILATVLYSKPYWPDVPRAEFDGFVMHSSDMGIHHQELTSEKVNRITVYGGCKSSVDAIIFCLQAGKKVDWVIRETGNSPGLMAEVRKHGVHGAILVGW
jgi:dimethylaniline monooxygenase (N-oxide forming)